MRLLLLNDFFFLTVPRTPEIDVSSCVICDNTVKVAWQPAGEADSDSDISVSGPIECYELEYRKTNRDSSLRAAGEACWEKIHNIRETYVTVSGERSEVTSQVRGHMCGPFRWSARVTCL